MPTLKSEFVQLAAELIGDEFADLASPALFERSTGFDYATQTDTLEDQTLDMIRLEYEQNQFDGELVKSGDFLLIGEYADLSWEPSPDNTFATYEGKKSQVRLVDIDPASATVIVQLRPL